MRAERIQDTYAFRGDADAFRAMLAKRMFSLLVSQPPDARVSFMEGVVDVLGEADLLWNVPTVPPLYELKSTTGIGFVRNFIRVAIEENWMLSRVTTLVNFDAAMHAGDPVELARWLAPPYN